MALLTDGSAAANGAERVYFGQRPVDVPPSTFMLQALTWVAHEEQPDVILVAASAAATCAAARLAQRLGGAWATHCIAVERGPRGTVEVERRVIGGRFLAREKLLARPALITLALQGAGLKSDSTMPVLTEGEAETRALNPDLENAVAHVIAVRPRVRSSVSLSKAPVIVGAGRGVRRPEDLAILAHLAHLLGGEVSGTRPLTDDLRWLEADRKVGLSGQTVHPELYIACGISGQIEHLMGMREARTVVAINSDAAAPIHAEADYSVVGDLYEVVPAMIAALEGEKRQLSL